MWPTFMGMASMNRLRRSVISGKRCETGVEAIVSFPWERHSRPSLPDITGDKFDDLCGLGGKAPHEKRIVQKEGGDVGTVEQILHVVAGPGQLVHFGLQLMVNRLQFLVHRPARPFLLQARLRVEIDSRSTAFQPRSNDPALALVESPETHRDDKPVLQYFGNQVNPR